MTQADAEDQHSRRNKLQSEICVSPLHTLSDWQIYTVARKGPDEGFPGT